MNMSVVAVNNPLYLEGFPFWNSKVISGEVSSRYQTPYFSLTNINIRTSLNCTMLCISQFQA